MEEFIARENIKRFKAQLRASTDDRQKATLQQLLEAEEQRLQTIVEDKAGSGVRGSRYSAPNAQRS